MSQLVHKFTSLSKKSNKNKSTILLEIVEEPINMDIYTVARSPYISSEFIPVKSIKIFALIELLFENKINILYDSISKPVIEYNANAGVLTSNFS